MGISRISSTLTTVHRWLGASVGAIFAVGGLSGALLIFQPQLFEWAHGELLPAQLSTEVGSMEAWIGNAQAAVPELGEPIVAWAPHVSHNVSRAGMVLFENDRPGGFGDSGFVAVLVNPASSEVLGIVDVDSSLAYAPIFLHSKLWAGETGEAILSFVVVGALLLLLIGIVRWWPSAGSVARKLSPRPWRTLATRARRLHDWTGIWSVALLLLATVTGAYMIQPSWFEPVLRQLPDEPAHVNVAGAPGECARSMGLDAAIELLRSKLPDASLASVVPDGALANGRWHVAFSRRGSQAPQDESEFLVDTKCGTIAAMESPDSRTARATATMWIHGLHEGTVFGSVGEWLIAAVGLLPLLMLWTGLRSWWTRS